MLNRIRALNMHSSSFGLSFKTITRATYIKANSKQMTHSNNKLLRNYLGLWPGKRADEQLTHRT